MKPCRHTAPKPGCRVCWLYEHDTRYRALWGGDPATVTPSIATPPPPQITPEMRAKLDLIKGRIRLPCKYLGEALETKSGCGCGASSLRRQCALLGSCRIYAPRASDIETVAQCVGCEQYEARDVEP